MSRVSIYEFFGDCEVTEYEFRGFDNHTGAFDFSKEPLKKITEVEVTSITQAWFELERQIKSASSNRFISVFDSEDLKVGFHISGRIKGMSACRSGLENRYWRECNSYNDSFLEFLKKSDSKKTGDYTLHIFLGSDQIYEMPNVGVDDAGEFLMEFSNKSAEFCLSTEVIPALVAVLKSEATVWVKTGHLTEFTLVDDYFNKAISVLRKRNILSEPKLNGEMPSAAAIERARNRLAR